MRSEFRAIVWASVSKMGVRYGSSMRGFLAGGTWNVSTRRKQKDAAKIQTHTIVIFDLRISYVLMGYLR